MARQNIDEKWKTDPRRTALANRIGGRSADGMRVEVNWLILEHKGRPIPLKEFKYVESWQEWVACGLGEVRDDLVFMAGADVYAEFFEKQRLNGTKGGRPKTTQTNPAITQTKPNNPSSSSSSSSSGSKKERKNTYAFSEQFERLAKKYRETFKGTTTGHALPRFQAQVADLTTVAEIELSMVHYRKVLDANDWRQPKTTFATYLGTETSGHFWREYITMPELPDKPGLPADDSYLDEMFKQKAVST